MSYRNVLYESIYKSLKYFYSSLWAESRHGQTRSARGRYIKLLLAAMVLGFLSGCSPLQKDFRSKNYFSLEIAPLERPESEAPGFLPKGLLIRELAISPEFATSFFVYQVSPVQYEEDYYNQFMVPPARMITNLLRENLYDAGLFRPVSQGEPDDIDFRLSGKIVHLYVDMKDTAHPCCVLSMRLMLDHQERKQEFVQIMSQLYQARLPVGSNHPRDMALGWSECLHQILSQFYEDMQAQGIVM